MSDELRSILIGTSGLSIALLVALFLTLTRPPVGASAEARNRLMCLAAAVLLIQVVHFTEEWTHEFHERLPGLLGLRAWSAGFFLSFNLFWIAVWGLSVVGLRTHQRVALFPIWFLGIGSTLNGIAHPLLSAVQAGYFPGLWTSPVVGVAGALLLRRLVLFTGHHGASLRTA